MMMDWFRSHHGAPTDPKWRTIAKRADVAPGVVVSIAWALLDAASQAPDRGSVAGVDAETLADFMGYEVELVERVIAAMRDKGVLAGGRFSAWERRQPKREDDGAAERKRQQRERERLEREEAKRREAAQADLPLVPPCHDTSHDVTTEQRRAEQSREEAGRPAHAREDAPEPAACQPMSDAEFRAEACHVVAAWPEPKGSFKPMLALVSDRAEALVVMREVVATRGSPVGSWKLWADDIVPERIAARTRSKPSPAARGSPPPDDGPRVNTPSGPRSVAFLLAEHTAGRWSPIFGKPPGQRDCPIAGYLPKNEPALEPAE